MMSKQTVLYQGIVGSYSYIASKYMCESAKLVGLGSFREVFANLAKEKGAMAVLPIYNTVIGSIFEVYDLVFEHSENSEEGISKRQTQNSKVKTKEPAAHLERVQVADRGLTIVGEVDVKVDHNLLGVGSQELESSGERLKQVEGIYSHEKALNQCQKLFDAMPWARRVVWEDTAAAAAYVASVRDPKRAAIASLSAAEEYGLEVLKRKVQSDGENWTRFVVLAGTEMAAGPAAAFPPGTPTRGPLPGGPPSRVTPSHLVSSSIYKTSLVFVAAHKPGSLLSCLQPFAKEGLNLSKIESRPLVGKAWQYLFYLDFEHDELNGRLKKVMEEIRPHTQVLRHLGTYPKGEMIGEKMGKGGVEIVEIGE